MTRPTEKSTRPRDMVNALLRPSPGQLAARDIRAALPARDLTGLLLGDPPVGRSALDKIIKEQCKAENSHDGVWES